MKAVMSWSTGKDSAYALDCVLRQGTIDVRSLLVTVGSEFDRVSMHGVRRDLAKAQARSLGLDLVVAEIPSECSMGCYGDIMGAALEGLCAAGVTAVIFGDLFLRDVRDYRESRLADVGMEAVFPLWGEDTAALARQMIDSGLRAIVTCVDTERLDGSFAGRPYDRGFLEDLPQGVDPCGENGEIHTFCWSCPDFAEPLTFDRGRAVLRDGRFRFLDLLPRQ